MFAYVGDTSICLGLYVVLPLELLCGVAACDPFVRMSE